MRNKCYLPKSLEEIKNLPEEKFDIYWKMFFKWDTPSKKSKYRPLWYAIQCELQNKHLASKNITRLNRYSQDPEGHIQKANKKKYELAIGTIITKKYKNKEYQVIVKDKNLYEYEGKIYNSLTAITYLITKNHKSGPRFFGLTLCKE